MNESSTLARVRGAEHSELKMWPSVQTSLERFTSVLRQRGIRATFRALGALVRRSVYVRERHVWYELELGSERPTRPLPDGLRVSRVLPAEAELLLGLDAAAPSRARQLMIDGGELWLVRSADRAAFACWIFGSETPVAAAKTGYLQLPHGTACLEDSVTFPSYRGQGIAPAAWCMIADSLAERRFERLLTKVAADNVASRRAVAKAGFREVAYMSFDRLGRRNRVGIEGEGATAAFLRAELAR